MPRYDVPQNVGKLRVAMGVGGKYTVWNGKQGKHEFAIPCRSRKQAEEIARILNGKVGRGKSRLVFEPNPARIRVHWCELADNNPLSP